MKHQLIPDNETIHRALVVFSGGQDSTTVLAVARKHHGHVEAVTFDYGQRHSTEISSANIICVAWNIPQHIIAIDGFGELSESALTNTKRAVGKPHELNNKLPSSFVPGRNGMMLAIAHGLAQSRQLGVIYMGVCQTDYSGYPDCRDTFIQATASALNLGRASGNAIEVRTPLMYLTKAQTFQLAADVGCLPEVLELSHTCYVGDRSPHQWGHGCGTCPACVLREKGWREFRASTKPKL